MYNLADRHLQNIFSNRLASKVISLLRLCRLMCESALRFGLLQKSSV